MEKSLRVCIYLNLIRSHFGNNFMPSFHSDFSWSSVAKLKLNLCVSVKRLTADQMRRPNEHLSGSKFCSRQAPRATWKATFKELTISLPNPEEIF